MIRKTFPQQLYLPPRDRPHWQPPDPSRWDLLYLSWGLRWYGEFPIPTSRHEGWNYLVILQGSPTVLINGAPRKAGPGMAYI